jgi:hypothetical protein
LKRIIGKNGKDHKLEVKLNFICMVSQHSWNEDEKNGYLFLGENKKFIKMLKTRVTVLAKF